MIETETEKLVRMGMWAWSLENYEKELLILKEIKILLSDHDHLKVINELIEEKKESITHAKMRLNGER